ncbi:MAG: MG2 domain-containing protein [Pseudomonadota bacterium]|nr:MG2 domain-containing protein [Pseudomonadota bacterium]
MRNLTKILEKLIGNIAWEKPFWIKQVLAKPKQLALWSAVIVLSIVTVFGCKYWYQHRPYVPQITLQFNPLNIPLPSDTPQEPPMLCMTFGEYPQYGSALSRQAVMPLNTKLYQEFVTSKISIAPELSGQWKWMSDSELCFTPKTSWLAHQQYDFTFDATVFTPQVKFATLNYSYTTPALEAKLSDLSLYQDPRNPVNQHIITTIEFNYPISHESLANNIVIAPRMSAKKLGNPLPVTISYAKNDRVAYLKTANVKLPDVPTYYVVQIAKGLREKMKNATLEAEVSEKILLPDASTIFNVKEINASIVRTPAGVPQQVLMVKTSLGVSQAQLQKFITVSQLPADREWTSVEDVMQNKALQRAKPLQLIPIPQTHEGDSLTSFRIKAEAGPKQALFINIAAGLPGEGGYQLNHAAQKLLPVPAYPKEIRFLHQGALLSLSQEHKISLSARGFKTIRYEIGRILPNEINHLITQTFGDFANPLFSSDYFSKADISQIFTQEVDLNASDFSQAQYTAFDFDRYLKPSAESVSPLGLFLLKVEGYNRETKTAIIEGSTTRLILVTDMSLIVKRNKDESHEVFVSSITTGLPLNSVKIAVLGKNGQEVISGQSDSMGHVHLQALSSENYFADREPVVITATKESDISFIPFAARDRELNYSRYEIDGINDDISRLNLSACIFTDRGIYRPGETAHIGMIVKQAYAQLAQAGIPLELKITSPQGKEVFQQKYNLSETGFDSVDFTTPEVPSGDFEVALYIHRDNDVGTFLGSERFLVQDFLPDTLKITSQYSVVQPEGWVSPRGLQLKVQLSNLDGTASANQRVTAKMILSPREFKFTKYADYTFNDPYFDKKKAHKTITEELPEQLTDEKGAANFELPLANFDSASYSLTSYVQGFEKNGGRSVSTQVQTLVSPLEYLIGYKPDGNNSLIKQGTKRSVNIIAINNKLERMAKQNLKVSLLQSVNIVTLIQQDNGTYKYQNTAKENTLSTQAVTIPAEGLNFEMPTDQVGNFVLAVFGENSTLLARIPYGVGGDLDSDRQKNAELRITLDKEQYQAGDEIQLQISAPYAGSGLITIERDKVFTYQWFTTTTTNSAQKIRIPADFIGNGYVNITFIRDWNSPEIFATPLSYAVAAFRPKRKP